MSCAERCSRAVVQRARACVQVPAAVHVIDVLACSVDRDARAFDVSFLLPPRCGGLPLEDTLAVFAHMNRGFLQASTELRVAFAPCLHLHTPQIVS